METGWNSVKKTLPAKSKRSCITNDPEKRYLKEHIGSSQTRQKFDSRWNQYSEELNPSHRKIPQVEKSKSDEFSRCSQNERKEMNDNFVSAAPLGDRIKKFLGQKNAGPEISLNTTAKPSPLTPVRASKIFSKLRQYSGNYNSIVPLPPDFPWRSSQHNDGSTLKSEVEHNLCQMKMPIYPDPDVESVIEPSKSNVDSDCVLKLDDTFNNKTVAVTLDPRELYCAQTKIIKLPEDSNLSQSSSTEQNIYSIHQDISSSDSTSLSDEFVHPLTQDTARNRSFLKSSTRPQSYERELVESQNISKILSEPGTCSSMYKQHPNIVTSSTSQITQKEIPSNSPAIISMSTTTNALVSKEFQNKSLPRTPADSSSHDLVATLQAHLDSLTLRRRKISRCVKQINDFMPQDSLLLRDDLRIKREREKRMIKTLLEEEADIKRQEYEVGLRLHRAWKRTESGFEYEPTSLWVRRVTGVGKNWSWALQDLSIF